MTKSSDERAKEHGFQREAFMALEHFAVLYIPLFASRFVVVTLRGTLYSYQFCFHLTLACVNT